MRTLILGLGNPILRDDCVGLLVARQLFEQVRAPGIELAEAAVASIDLLPLVEGYDRAVLIDALLTASPEPGRLHFLTLDDLPAQPTLTSAHGIGVRSALELGRALGVAVPPEVSIYGIEVDDPYSFASEPTPAVAAAIPAVVESIRRAEFPESRKGSAG